MKLYLQTSAFADAFRVRVQLDEHGGYVNVHIDHDAGHGYLSLDVESARLLSGDLADAARELELQAEALISSTGGSGPADPSTA